jgi:hypothetical protein
MTEKINLSNIIRKEFDKHKTIKLEDLYHTIQAMSVVQGNQKDIHHRVRSRINGMVQKGQIKRIAPSTYEKI